MTELTRKNRRQGHGLALAVALLTCIVAVALSVTTPIPANQLLMLGAGGALMGALLWPILPVVFDQRTGL